MGWDEVALFLAVVRAGSFTEAARSLGLHQSTISRRISDLEEDLGGRLFQRSARSFELTPLAARLVPQAEAAEAAMERFRRRAVPPDQPEGTVRLATAEEIAGELLVPALGQLWAKAPKINLVIEGRTELVALGPGAADIALRVVRPEQGNLRFRKVGELRYGIYSSAEYLERSAVTDGAWHWLALDDPEGRLQETRWLEARSGGGRPRLRCSDTRDLARAAADGWGVAVLPEAIAARRDLVCVEAIELVRTLWLVTHEALVQEARVRAVLDWVVEACDAATQSSG